MITMHASSSSGTLYTRIILHALILCVRSNNVYTDIQYTIANVTDQLSKKEVATMSNF